VLPLTYHFIQRECCNDQPAPTVEPDVINLFEQYPWPGNVRELENAIKHAITFSRDNVIKRDCLPAKMQQFVSVSTESKPVHKADEMRGKSLKAFLRTKEKEYLSQVLQYSDGDKQKAAKTLKISLATLYRKLPEPKE